MPFPIQLNPTHEAIVQAVLQKAAARCPGSLSLIAVYGSVARGDVHAHSDLDLLLVTNDDGAQVLGHTFVLEGIGQDLYCTPWHRLEQEAADPNVNISRWMDCIILWQESDVAAQRLHNLRMQAAELLTRRTPAQAMELAAQAFTPAYPAYARLMYRTDLPQCRMESAMMLYAAQYAVCIANRAYFRKGVADRYAELASMALRPQNLIPLMEDVVRAADLPALRTACTALMGAMDTFLQPEVSLPLPRDLHTLQPRLTGTWEEMVSNWRGKLQQAALQDDAHLALMSIAACQFMVEEAGIPDALLPKPASHAYLPHDPAQCAENFDAFLQQYGQIYYHAGMPRVIYTSLDEFIDAYTGQSHF